jgi:hypothetical protein
VVLPAEHLVGDVHVRVVVVGLLDVADHDDVALDDHHAVLGTGVVGGALAAPAQRLDLQDVHPVGELDETRGAGEHQRAEVGEDPEGEDVDLQLVDDLGQGVDLFGGVELRLVADEVVDPAALGQVVDDVAPEVELAVDLDRVVGQAQATREAAGAGTVAGDEDLPHTAAGGVVVVGLERQRALAGVHGAGEELELSHGARS